MLILRQSSAIDVLIGPFVDGTDGATPEEALSPSVQLSKNGQTAATKNDVTTPVHDNAGFYNCEFDATDTGTVGQLVAFVEGSTATHLTVRHEFQIVDTAAFDALFADGAEGPLQATTVGNTLDVSATGEAGLDWANIGSPTTAQNLSGTNIDVDQIVASVSGNVDGNVTGSVGSNLELGPAEVNTEVDTALADINLDHWVGTATAIPAIVAGTYFDQMVDDGTAVFDRTTDSLQAMRDVVALEATVGALNDVAATDIVSSGAITTSGGAVSTVTTVGTTTTNTDMRGTDSAALASVLGALADAAAAGVVTSADTLMAYVKQLVGANVIQNVLLNDIPFVMLDTTTEAGKTGVSVTATRSLDGGVTFGATTGSVTETGNGAYTFDATAADMNGTSVMFKFSGTDAIDAFASFFPIP